MPITIAIFTEGAEQYAKGVKAEKIEACPNRENVSLITSHTGRVLSLRERNSYSDSDFLALVLDHDGKFREIEYATTRGYTYDNGARIDATPEVIKAYEAHIANVTAEFVAMREARIQKECDDASITKDEYKRLVAVYPATSDTFHAIMKLLQTRRFRSTFRQSMAQRIREWVAQETPLYRYPLTAKQLSYI